MKERCKILGWSEDGKDFHVLDNSGKEIVFKNAELIYSDLNLQMSEGNTINLTLKYENLF